MGALIAYCKYTILAILAVSVFPSASHGQKAPAFEIENVSYSESALFEYPESGTRIGQGWNSFSATPTAYNCVNVIEVPVETSEYLTYAEEIKSRYSLLKKSSVKAKASGSKGGVSGSASVEASKLNSFKSDFTNLLFTFRSIIGSTQAAGTSTVPYPHSDTTIRSIAELSPEAQKTLVLDLIQRPKAKPARTIELSNDAKTLITTDPTLTLFKLTCGDGFISAIHRGTEAKILATYRSTDRKEQETFKASIKASGFGFSGSASTSQSEDLSTFDSKSSFAIYQKGGAPVGPPKDFTGLRDIIADASTFIQNPTAYNVSVTAYTNLASFHLATQGNDIKIPNPIALNSLASYYIVLSDLYEIVEDIYLEELIYGDSASDERIYSHSRVSSYGGLPHLRGLRDRIQIDLQFLENAVSDCLLNADDCSENGVIERLHKDKEELKQAVKVTDRLGVILEDDGALKSPLVETERKQLLNLFNINPTSGQNEDELLNETLKLFSTDEVSATKNALAKEEEKVDRISSRVPQSNSFVPNEFYQSFYSYLIEIPLSKSALGDEIQLAEAPQDTSSFLNNTVQSAILVNRLLPWKSYFCQDNMSEKLCVSDEILQTLLVQSKFFKTAKDGTVLLAPECKTVRVLVKKGQCSYAYVGRHGRENLTCKKDKYKNRQSCQIVTLPTSPDVQP